MKRYLNKKNNKLQVQKNKAIKRFSASLDIRLEIHYKLLIYILQNS